MPCPRHPEVDAKDCPACDLYEDIMRVHGCRNRSHVDLFSARNLARIGKDGGKRRLFDDMIPWMESCGVKLYRTENGR